MEDIDQLTNGSALFLTTLGIAGVILAIAFVIGLMVLSPAMQMSYLCETDFGTGVWMILIIHAIMGGVFYFYIYSSIAIMVWWMIGYTATLNAMLGSAAWLKRYG